MRLNNYGWIRIHPKIVTYMAMHGTVYTLNFVTTFFLEIFVMWKNKMKSCQHQITLLAKAINSWKLMLGYQKATVMRRHRNYHRKSSPSLAFRQEHVPHVSFPHGRPSFCICPRLISSLGLEPILDALHESWQNDQCFWSNLTLYNFCHFSPSEEINFFRTRGD